MKTFVRDIFGNSGYMNEEQPTLFSALFFSQDNINEIQNQIRYKVYQENQEVIDNQNHESLLLVMKKMYFRYARIPKGDINDPKVSCHYTEQIAMLNDFVINDSIDKILIGMFGNKKYLENRSKIPFINQNPVFANRTNRKGNVIDISKVLYGTSVFSTIN